jgi:hypothetical protein
MAPHQPKKQQKHSSNEMMLLMSLYNLASVNQLLIHCWLMINMERENKTPVVINLILVA